MKHHHRMRRSAPTLFSTAEEASSAADEVPEASVLLVTEDEALRDEVALIAAVVGVGLDTAARWPAAEEGSAWAAVMCSAESLPPTAAQAQGTLLLGHDAEVIWEAAARMHGLRPVPLPQAENWLREQLSAQAFRRSQGKVVAAVSTAGGAGSTTFAYLCAAELAARGSRPLLIDAVLGPASGLAALVKQARGQQLRGGDLDWRQLSRIEGEISASHLEAALPVLDGIGVLTGTAEVCQRVPLLPAAAAAGRSVFDVVIIDIGQRTEVMPALAEQLETLLVVTRASRRAVDAAHRLLRAAAPIRTAVAVNHRSARGWGPQDVAEELPAPVVADLAEQRWLACTDDLADAYELLRSTRGANIVADVLEALGVADE